jgi:hypothetical protein
MVLNKNADNMDGESFGSRYIPGRARINTALTFGLRHRRGNSLNVYIAIDYASWI